MGAVSAERAVQVGGAGARHRCERPRTYRARHGLLEAAASSVKDPADLAPLAKDSAVCCAAIRQAVARHGAVRPRGAERAAVWRVSSPGQAGMKRSLLT